MVAPVTFNPLSKLAAAPETVSPPAEMVPVLLIPVFAVKRPLVIVVAPVTFNPLSKFAAVPETVSPPPEMVPVLLIPVFAVRRPAMVAPPAVTVNPFPIVAPAVVVKVPPDIFWPAATMPPDVTVSTLLRRVVPLIVVLLLNRLTPLPETVSPDESTVNTVPSVFLS